MHRDLAVPPSRCDDTLGQKVIPTPAATQPRMLRSQRIPGAVNEYSSLLNRLSSLIRYEQPTEDDGFQIGYRGRSSMPRIERESPKQVFAKDTLLLQIRCRPAPQRTRPQSAFNNVLDETAGRSRRDDGTDLWIGFGSLRARTGAEAPQSFPGADFQHAARNAVILAAALASLSSLDIVHERKAYGARQE